MQLIKINLIPRKKSIELPKIPIGSILGVLILCGMAYYLWMIDKPSREDKIEEARQKLSSLQKKNREIVAGKKQELERINQDIAAIRRKVELVRSHIGTANILTWAETLQDFSNLTSKLSIWLTRLSSDESNKLSLAGIAKKDINQVGNFMEKIKDNKNYSDVFLQSITKGEKFGITTYTFGMTCRIKKGTYGGEF